MTEDWMTLEKYRESKEMASQHWGYVEKVILRHQPKIPPSVLETIKYHYTTAMVHGYGHGYEDAKKEASDNSEA